MSVNRDPKILYGPSRLPWKEQLPEGARPEPQGTDVYPPSDDPLDLYPRVPPPNVKNGFPRIDDRMFQVPPTGLSEAERAMALAAFRDFAETQHRRFTGYQCNQNQEYSSRFSWLLDMHTNNVGDPFGGSWFTLNTKFLERACLDYFAALWHVDWPHVDLTPEQVKEKTDDELACIGERYWGWVLSMGSTEGNLYSLFNARDYLKGRYLKDGRHLIDESFDRTDEDGKCDPYYKPIVFYSHDTHYSVIKCLRILELTRFGDEGAARGMPCPLTESKKWPNEVPSNRDGSIKVDDLETLMVPFLEKGYPVIVVLNVGSTWKGAYDNVEKVDEMLLDLAGTYPYLKGRPLKKGDEDSGTRRGYWLHVDGALGAFYLPFLEMAQIEHGWKPGKTVPKFDFRLETVMSIVASTHKWPGAPWAGSIYMTKTGYQLNPPSNPSYIGSADTTLGGSRNAFTAALLWDYLARTSYEQSMQAAMKAEAVGDYLVAELQGLEADLKRRFGDEVDLWIERTDLSLAVRFRLVNPELVYKYSIDRERLRYRIPGTDEEEARTCCHVYLMQSLTRDLARRMVEDIRAACEHHWNDGFPRKDDFDGDNPEKRQPITMPTAAGPGQMLIAHGQGLGAARRRPVAAVRQRTAVTV